MYLHSTFTHFPANGTSPLFSLAARPLWLTGWILLSLFQAPLQAQNLDWARQAGGAGYQEAGSLAADAAGNAFVVGTFQGSIGFNPGAGNLNSTGVFDVFFAKYNNAGAAVWAKQVGGTGLTFGYDIATDAPGNVFISGNFNGTIDFDPGPGTKNLTSNNSLDAFLAKYNPSGDLLWAHRLGGAQFEEARSITADAAGNVLVAGIFNDSVDFDPGPGTAALQATAGGDVYLAKFSPAGALLWAKLVEGAGFERVLDMTTNAAGHLFVTGHFQGSADFDPSAADHTLDAVGDSDLFFARYDTGGNFVWAKNVGGFFYEEARGIAVDRFDNVYLTGRYGETVDFDPGPGIGELENAGINDAFFAKYDADGAFVWANSIGGNGNDIGNSIAVDTLGQVYLTGQYMNTVDFDPGGDTSSLSATGDIEIFLARYDASGHYLWAGSIGGTKMEESTTLALDAQHNIYLTGFFKETADFNPGPGTANLTSGGEEDAFIAKFKAAVTTATTQPNTLKVSIYPVPATNTLHVTMPDPTAPLDVAVFDQSGRLVAKQQGQSGMLSVDLAGFAAGIYYARIVSGEGVRAMAFEVLR